MMSFVSLLDADPIVVKAVGDRCGAIGLGAHPRGGKEHVDASWSGGGSDVFRAGSRLTWAV